MDATFPTVWSATRQRVQSMSKLVVFDDRGSLEESAGKLRFAGKKTQLERGDICAIELTAQTVNWVAYAVVDVAIIVYFWYLELPLALAVVIFIAANGFGLLIGTQTKWVHVAYRDGAGRTGEAYFADASRMG